MTMTKFEDQLLADLMREYGPTLQSIQRPAATRRRVVSWVARLAAAWPRSPKLPPSAAWRSAASRRMR
jgi:hypothetical protein